mgnify:CR=1 FL=1
MKTIIKKSLENTYSYLEYKNLIKNLLSKAQSTGLEQSDALTEYSKLNDKRMKRLDKTIKLSETTIEKFKQINQPQTWLILTEGWCGDAAQNLPVIYKLSEINENIELKIVLRDENTELMNSFLTNGGKAIPKLIGLDKNENVLFTWGPRPTTATKMVADYKAKHGSLSPEFKQDLQVWYNKNKGESIQDDFVEIIKKL